MLTVKEVKENLLWEIWFISDFNNLGKLLLGFIKV
jgi:hypothetical protein